jgi:hypothetical protein
VLDGVLTCSELPAKRLAVHNLCRERKKESCEQLLRIKIKTRQTMSTSNNVSNIKLTSFTASLMLCTRLGLPAFSMLADHNDRFAW